MLLICCALLGPAFQSLLLPRGKNFSRVRRRHHFVAVFRVHPSYQLAFTRFSRHDGRSTGFGRLDGVRAKVESQVCLTRVLIGTMTMEAIVGQYWSDITVELDSPGYR